MKNTWWKRKEVVIAAVVLGTGLVRMPVENRLLAELREDGFHPQAEGVNLADRVGVQGFIGALGGLRYMVATFLELEAYTLWEPPPKWDELREAYQLINLLQPRNVESWETAAWHLAYNAAAYYRDLGERLTPLQREVLAEEYEQRGVETLKRGIRWNPEAASLYLRLAEIYRYKMRDHCQAADLYEAASKLADAPGFYYRFFGYSLARCPGREEDAYRVLKNVYEEGRRVLAAGGPMIWKPTVIVELNRLEKELDVPWEERIPERFDDRTFRIATPWRPEESHPLYLDLLRRSQAEGESAVEWNPEDWKALAEVEEKLGIAPADRIRREDSISGGRNVRARSSIDSP